MLIIPPPKFRKVRRVSETPVPIIAPLVLVSATFVPTAPYTLNLTFDRAVDLSAMVPAMIVVNDPVTLNSQLTGSTHFTQPSPNVLQIKVGTSGPASGSAVVLNVGAGNGIVAVDDGAAWGGAAGLILPFGS